MAIKPSELNKLFWRMNLKNFDRTLNKVNLVSAGDGKCTALLKIEEQHSNCLGGLHGGFSATLIDIMSSYALTTLTNESMPHLSVSLNTEFFRTAKIGDEIQIDANTIKVGRNLAFLEVFIREKETGSVLVKGSHTKFVRRND